MKKTIREDIEEKYLRTVLVNDNALLIYTEDENNPDRINLRVRYIRESTIRESRIATLTREQFLAKRDMMFEFNQDRTALAFYREDNDTFYLDLVYDFTNHSSYTTHMTEMAYDVKFPNHKGQYVRK